MVNQIGAPRRSPRFQLTPADSSSNTDTDTGTVVPGDSSQHMEEQAEGSEYSLPSEQYQDLPPLPPSPSTHPLTFYPTMSDTSVTSSLNEAAKIKKLNGPDDWVEWNRKLRGHLGMVDLWTTLTGTATVPPAGTPQHTLWETHQRKLASLLLLITGPSALSLIELKIDDTATEQYLLLKATYNTTTITTFSMLYRKIFKCSLSNHKSLKEYGEEVTNARNKLKGLGIPIPELGVTCAFLDGLDPSYQAWKDMFLGGYAKNPTTTENGKVVMIVPTIEEVLKLLIDRESSNLTPTSSSQHSASRAFNAKRRDNKDDNKESSTSSKSPARSGKSPNSQRPQRYCDVCYSTRHISAHCWYIHSEKQTEEFRKNHPNPEAIAKALDEARKANKEWQKSHPPKSLIAKAKTSTTGDKDAAWYLDSAASVHMTYHLKDYIHPDLDNQHEDIEMANGQYLKTRGAGTIALEVMVFGIPTYVHIHNVHYCPEIDSNFLSLGTFGAKGFEFYTKKGILHVKDTVGDTVLQAKCKGQIYPLLQPTTPKHSLSSTSVHTHKKTPSTPIQPVGDNLAGLFQPVGVTEALPPSTTLQKHGLPDDLQPGTDPRDFNFLDNALNQITQLLAKASNEAAYTPMPLEETDTVTNITAEINTNINPAIGYTAPPNPFILDHPRSTIYQRAISGPQPKESWQTAQQNKASSQPKKKTFRITRPLQEDKFTPIFRSDNTHVLPSPVPATKNWKMRHKKRNRRTP